MVTELPDKMIAKGYIVKGKEREFARDVLLQLKSILKGISLYVADFILDTIICKNVHMNSNSPLKQHQFYTMLKVKNRSELVMLNL